MTHRVGALLLAAGFSKRFGSAKLLARLTDGRSVFSHTLEQIGASVSETLVITRPELADELTQYDTEVIVFEQAERGMGASLAFGIGQAQQRNWDVCLVCLSDMPFIQTSTYQQIVAAADSSSIVIPSFQDQPGNPVAFGSAFYPELGKLSGDAGGRPVVRQHPDRVTRLPCDDSAILSDVDTPEELQRMQAKYA